MVLDTFFSPARGILFQSTKHKVKTWWGRKFEILSKIVQYTRHQKYSVTTSKSREIVLVVKQVLQVNKQYLGLGYANN